MASGARVRGLRETVRRLERYGVSTQDLKTAFRKIGATVARTADQRVVKKSGDLAGTIRPSNTKNKAVVRAGGYGVKYAGVNNYANPGKRWLNTAADDHERDSILAIEAELRDLIAKYDLT